MTTHRQVSLPRVLLNKVPQITLYFWIIKVLCTTVGETAADFLNVILNLGLTGVSVMTGALPKGLSAMISGGASMVTGWRL